MLILNFQLLQELSFLHLIYGTFSIYYSCITLIITHSIFKSLGMSIGSNQMLGRRFISYLKLSVLYIYHTRFNKKASINPLPHQKPMTMPPALIIRNRAAAPQVFINSRCDMQCNCVLSQIEFTQQLAQSTVTYIQDGDDIFNWTQCGPLSTDCVCTFVRCLPSHMVLYQTTTRNASLLKLSANIAVIRT